MSVLEWIAVLALGGAGAVLRFVIDSVITKWLGRDFPLGTLVVNLSGAAALGFITGIGLSGPALILVGTATLGSYTTFSTWMLDTHRLRDRGAVMKAFANVAVSLVLGIAAIALGRALGAQL